MKRLKYINFIHCFKNEKWWQLFYNLILKSLTKDQSTNEIIIKTPSPPKNI